MHLFLLTAVAASRLADAASLDLKERPVSKVIKLLEQMQADLSAEAEQDQELYEKLSCWCETNGKEKGAAIDEANRRIDGLTSDIQRLTATGQELTASIATLQDEIAKNKDALEKASAIRAEELADFNAEEKDMIASIASLGGAITALAKHQSFLQVGSSISSADLRRVVQRAHLSEAQRSQVDAFLSQAPSAGSYASQSGAIFGILEQMKETFETNTAQSQKDEAEAASEFASLKAAKTEEIRSASAMVDSQTTELANTEEANAAAKQNLKDTKAALASDTTFLRDLKERCANADAEYEERTTTRNEEIKAIGETIGILNSDESHDLMASTLGTFLQKDTRRQRAMRVLRAAAAKSGSAALGLVAQSTGLDAFEKVHKAIDEMVVALKQEMADEVAHKDFCTKELAENDEQIAVAQDEIGDLTAQIGDLESTLKTLKSELGSATSRVKESKVQMQRASEDREGENAEFQKTVADQRGVQQILQKAKDRMQQFYGEALLQVHAKAKQQHRAEPGAEAPPAPEGFKTYEKKNGGGVMGLLQGILDEAKAMENEALKAEHDSQTAYEEFMKDSNASIKTLNHEITDKTERKAAAEAALVQAQDDQKRTLNDSENLHNKKKTLHQSCDFTLNNFEVTQAARGSEIQALGEAKAILSGASF